MLEMVRDPLYAAERGPIHSAAGGPWPLGRGRAWYPHALLLPGQSHYRTPARHFHSPPALSLFPLRPGEGDRVLAPRVRSRGLGVGIAAEQAADRVPGIAEVPGEDVEVVDALGGPAVHHLQVDPAEARPRHAPGPAARLREELERAAAVRPVPGYRQALEVHVGARGSHEPGVGLQAQQRLPRAGPPRYLQEDVYARSVEVEALAVHVDEVGVAHARDQDHIGWCWCRCWCRCEGHQVDSFRALWDAADPVGAVRGRQEGEPRVIAHVYRLRVVLVHD